MTFEITLVFSLLVAAMVLFVTEWLSVDLVALVVVLVLVMSGVLAPEEAFAGFASQVIVILACLFVLAGALEETGIMAWLAASLRRLAERGESCLVASVMGFTAGLSAFFSNTTVTAVLMPGVVQLARQARLAPSRLLIPLAYASMLGGACTLVGTSANLAASGLMERLGLQGISLLELAPVGLVMALLGTVYMATLGRRLLPRRPVAESLSEAYRIRQYLSELVLGDEAAMVGHTLSDPAAGESSLGEEDVQVLAVSRGDRKLAPSIHQELRAGDVLLVQGSKESLLRLSRRKGVSLEAAPELADHDLLAGGTVMAEAVVMPASLVRGRTLRECRFRQTYGASVLAVFRRGQSFPAKVADLRLRGGDVLLLVAPEEELVRLGDRAGIWVMGEVDSLPVSRRKGLLALATMLAALAFAAFGWLPLSVSLLGAALAVVVTRCVSPENVYRLVAWRVLVLIGGMTALGVALESSGAASLLASGIAAWTAPLGTWTVVAAFIVLTMLFTQPLSNAAAVLVVLPVAVSTAAELGLDPRSLAILVTLSASLSFVAPLEPACLLVYAPGRYAFRDFVRVGLPLSALVFLVLLVLVPLLWPL